jgi:(2R)-ethylmalonyl-CoA mutase
MYETELTRYGDIFEGSTVIEDLTQETMVQAEAIARKLRAAGYARAISIISADLTRRLAERQRKLEAGEIVQVGVNAFQGELGFAPLAAAESAAAPAALEKERIESIRRWCAGRDNATVAKAREALEKAATAGADVMEATIDLARAGGTVGEWTESIGRATRGRYVPPILESAAGVQPLEVPTAKRPVRVALGKAGLDGHINAVKLLALACRQAGMEVILAGFKQTPAQLVEAAIQEDADILAVSSMAGAHMTIARETLALLNGRGASELKLVLGGIIPEHDRQTLLDLGVKAVFTPKDSNFGSIIGRLIELADRPS